MKYRLNFNRFLFTLFLSFVSFLNISSAESSTSGQVKKDNSKVTSPSVAPTPVADLTPTPTKTTEAATNTDAHAVAATPIDPLDAKIESLKAEIHKNPRNIKKIVELADLFYKKQDYEKTTLLLWKQIDKLDRPAIILLAKAHEQKKEPAEMIRALNILIGKDEKDFEAYSLLGNAYTLQKKNKDALDSYKKAIEINSKYEPAYLGIANLYEKRNPPNLYELRILFQDMIDNLGPKPEFFQKLCEVNAQDDNTFEAAIETCKQATTKDPKTANAFVNLGNSLKIAGKEEEANATLKKAANDFPKSEFAQYTYGKVLEDQKNTVDAMKYYKAGTEADPTAARSWLGLATMSFEIKKFEVSLIAYKNACKYDRKYAVNFRKATTALRNSKYTEWVGKFEAGAEACP
ncbi:tetratricopeptide repeat protein [Bdellovibrio svalbardensis]|uniref:Tetratricopeptide repeat protein n=1 Tax=Bdellovibrio svalbardensis TaxID=2972972 RepID=A0ABT6DFE1_9BACT|nr:tetratricopeptide repeat protein [Bdellovibrio svalbardensis]MDG0815000.1 tetratricopeptide repeat protein [Bdellovibrio svalbardensis]